MKYLYQKAWKWHCFTDINECESQPCLHGSTCIDNINSFSCVCTSGWQGPQCQLDTNECEGRPCVHAISCRDLLGDYTCECQLGWTGKNCDISKTGQLLMVLHIGTFSWWNLKYNPNSNPETKFKIKIFKACLQITKKEITNYLGCLIPCKAIFSDLMRVTNNSILNKITNKIKGGWMCICQYFCLCCTDLLVR